MSTPLLQWVKAPETKEGEDAAKEGKQAKPEDRTGMVKVDAKPWEVRAHLLCPPVLVSPRVCCCSF